ncbi:MAG: tyrosine-type recombinase/integrase [Actinomycetota bacterium]
MTRRSLGQITQVGPRLWRVRVSGGYDPVSGRRRRPGRTVEGTRADAERALAELTVEVGAGPLTSTSTTLGEYLTLRWLPHAQATVRARTYDGYARAVRKHLGTLADVRMDHLDPWAVDRWQAHLTRQGVPAGARRYAFTVLRIALRQAVRWRLIDADPTEAATRPRPTRGYEPVVLTAAQAQEVLAAFTGHALEPLVVLALGAGLRRSEALGLRWGDVDLDAGLVAVQRGFHGAYGYEQPKSLRSARVIALPSWAVGRLRGHRGAPLAPVVASSAGTPLDPSAASRRFRARLREVAGPDVPLKDLRHSHGTLALASGTDVVVVSRRLGHADVATTSRFYLRPHRSEDAAAAARLDDLLGD